MVLQKKLPWIQLKRFERWFWTTTRRKWIDSSSAATVLARQYVRSLKKDLSFSKTAAEMEEKASSLHSSPSHPSALPCKASTLSQLSFVAF